MGKTWKDSTRTRAWWSKKKRRSQNRHQPAKVLRARRIDQTLDREYVAITHGSAHQEGDQ